MRNRSLVRKPCLCGLLIALFALPALAQLAPPPTVATDDALRAFVCGSASPLGADPTREQACIAVTAGERIFLIDTGAGSNKNLGLAQFPMQHLKGVLLTHFHSDHIGALPDVNMGSWVAGRPEPLTVMGPAGVETVVSGFNAAYSLDRKYRNAHHGSEIVPLETAPMVAKTVVPGKIYENDGLTITAFKVDHSPVDPAFGYRFDFGGRSVVVSGDTLRNEALETASAGVDLLFHDTMALGVVKQLQGMLGASNPRLGKILLDIQDYHASAPDVVALAKAAGVKKLVFYHLIPNPAIPMVANAFKSVLPANGVIATDGMLFTLPINSEVIEQEQLLER